MKLNRVSGILSVAVLAGLWGCSSQKQVAQQYVYDDLYANSSDVRPVAYSNKRSGTVERVQPGDESVVTRGQSKESIDDYYSPELSAGNYKRGQPGYSNQDYDAGYADGFNNAQRTAGWNNVGWNSWNRWNSWNNWGWGGGFGGWGWNNWMSPGISIGLGWGRPWGWGGFYDPFWGGGLGWNNWGWGGGWGWNDWAWGGRPWGWGGGFGGWGRNRVWINNNYYYGNGGTGSGVVTNPGTNYARPRTRADYDRYQSAYNEDAYRSTATRNGQRSAADGNSYYSRPRQDYGSPSWNERNSSGGSGSYSRGGYSQPSYNGGNYQQNRSSNSGWNNSWSNRGSSSGFENRSSGSSSYGGSSGGSYGGGGGGGGRSRGPR